MFIARRLRTWSRKRVLLCYCDAALTAFCVLALAANVEPSRKGAAVMGYKFRGERSRAVYGKDDV